MSVVSSMRTVPAVTCVPWIQCCAYSTHKTDSDSGITNEILKSKIGELEKEGSVQSQQADLQSDKNDSDSQSKSKTDDKSKKKESWFSNKNAWKLGLIGLSISGVMLCGNLILMWGK
jgi:hypothetical protein